MASEGDDCVDFINRVNLKDVDAYKYLYDRYYISLCSYVSKIVSEKEEAKDIVQETILTVYEGRKIFSDIKELTNYLYRACYNNSLVHIRKQQTRDSILDSLGQQEDLADEDLVYALTVKEELIRQLYFYINELPEEQKKIMLLRIEGFNWNEIADKLKISINTVKTQRSRSFKFLRKKMDNSPFNILLFILIG